MCEDIDEKDHVGLIYLVVRDLVKNDMLCRNVFGTEVSEYLGEGYLALDIAKKNFKPEMGFKFSTFASSVIRQRIIQAAKRYSRIQTVNTEPYVGENDKCPDWELIEEIYARLNELNERTRNVLIMRYGLDGENRMTLEQVGLALDPPITRERVRQIEKKGLRKLKKIINM